MKNTFAFSILTYNIRGMLNRLGQSRVFDKLNEALEIRGVDIVCLQEAFLEKSSNKIEIGNLEKMYPYIAFGPNAGFEQGELGNAILSRFPIEAEKNSDLSVKNYEPRGCLQCTLKIGETERLEVMNIHFGLRRREQIGQYKILACYVESVTGGRPLILAGDFNDWLCRLPANLKWKDIELIDSFVKCHGTRARTFPSLLPVFPLDRIYYGRLTARNAHVLHKGWRRISDHLPLIATFY